MGDTYFTLENAPNEGDANGPKPREYASKYMTFWTPNETLATKYGDERVAVSEARRLSAARQEVIEVREHGGSPPRRLVAVYRDGDNILGSPDQ